MGAPTDNVDNKAATSTSSHRFPKPYLLVLELCASAGLPTWVDSMEMEFLLTLFLDTYLLIRT